MKQRGVNNRQEIECQGKGAGGGKREMFPSLNTPLMVYLLSLLNT